MALFINNQKKMEFIMPIKKLLLTGFIAAATLLLSGCPLSVNCREQPPTLGTIDFCWNDEPIFGSD
ncbi:MAG: hypothetical protein CML06_11595 [Pseudomonadales bacterium]|nr:hypothetical protein [Pseudomonadales bacterium]